MWCLVVKETNNTYVDLINVHSFYVATMAHVEGLVLWFVLMSVLRHML